MESELWTWVYQIAVILTGVVGGGGGVVVLTNRIKRWLQLQGNQALVLAGLVAVIVATAGLIAGQQIAPDMFHLDNLSEVVLLIYVASQEIYRRIKNSDDGDLPEGEWLPVPPGAPDDTFTVSVSSGEDISVRPLTIHISDTSNTLGALAIQERIAAALRREFRLRHRGI